MKTCAFKTLGCKVNQYETQALREDFIRLGYKEVTWGSGAGVYLINTCAVTRTAEQKSRHFIQQARRLNPEGRIVVTGCFAEYSPDRIKNIKEVDYIFPNNAKRKIASVVSSKPELQDEQDWAEITDFKEHNRAFIKIQDGCDRFCSYCIVPYLRGRSRSRDVKSVLLEAKRLAEKGFKEIVLTGICLGDYGKDSKIPPNPPLSKGGIKLSQRERIWPARGGGDFREDSLCDLIVELEKIDGIRRVRLSSIGITDVGEELINLFKVSRKLCPHLHISLQSGSEKILKLMRRNYTPAGYMDKVERLKDARPDISLTTDVLVGFPGEEDVDFESTFQLCEEAAFSRLHIFAYSKREGTLSYDFNPEVTPPVLKSRMKRMKELASRLSCRYREGFLGRVLSVLIESRRDGESGLLTGYTGNYIKVLVDPAPSRSEEKPQVRRGGVDGEDALRNKLVPVRITRVIGGKTFAITTQSPEKYSGFPLRSNNLCHYNAGQSLPLQIQIDVKKNSRNI